MKPTRARSCTGKRAHETKQSALDHIFKLKRKDAAVRMHVYACKFCKKFHVGHVRQRS
jgi:hypothetical protein